MKYIFLGTVALGVAVVLVSVAATSLVVVSINNERT